MADTAVIFLHTEEEHDEDWMVVRVLTDNGSVLSTLHFPLLPEYLAAGGDE